MTPIVVVSKPSDLSKPPDSFTFDGAGSLSLKWILWHNPKKFQGGFFSKFKTQFTMWLAASVCECECVCVCPYVHVLPLTARPGTCSCVSVSACVCLMECPKQSPRWDIMVRQTYSTTQIKINKQSEVFTLNTASFFKLCFFNEFTTWSGPQRRRQDLSLGEIR